MLSSRKALLPPHPQQHIYLDDSYPPSPLDLELLPEKKKKKVFLASLANLVLLYALIVLHKFPYYISTILLSVS